LLLTISQLTCASCREICNSRGVAVLLTFRGSGGSRAVTGAEPFCRVMITALCAISACARWIGVPSAAFVPRRRLCRAPRRSQSSILPSAGEQARPRRLLRPKVLR
jgi:hypothetical protein